MANGIALNRHTKGLDSDFITGLRESFLAVNRSSLAEFAEWLASVEGRIRDFSLKDAQERNPLRMSSPAKRTIRKLKAGFPEPSVLPVERKRRISAERPQKGHGSPVAALYWHLHTVGTAFSIRRDRKGKATA